MYVDLTLAYCLFPGAAEGIFPQKGVLKMSPGPDLRNRLKAIGLLLGLLLLRGQGASSEPVSSFFLYLSWLNILMLACACPYSVMWSELCNPQQVNPESTVPVECRTMALLVCVGGPF